MGHSKQALETIRECGFKGPVLAANWGQATDTILVCEEDDEELLPSPFQVADARHKEWEAAELLGIEDDSIGVISVHYDYDTQEWVTLGYILNSEGKTKLLFGD